MSDTICEIPVQSNIIVAGKHIAVFCVNLVKTKFDLCYYADHRDVTRFGLIMRQHRTARKTLCVQCKYKRRSFIHELGEDTTSERKRFENARQGGTRKVNQELCTNRILKWLLY